MGRPTGSGTDVGSATALGLALLGWLGAQGLTLGIVEQLSVLTGSEVLHRHEHAGPVAMVAIVGIAVALAFLAVRARFSRDLSAAPDALGTLAPLVPILVSLFLLAVAQVSELAVLAHHHLMPLIMALLLVAIMQGAAAVVAVYAWSAVMRSIARCGVLSRHAPLQRLRALATATGHYGGRPVDWVGKLAPGRGPPAQPVH